MTDQKADALLKAAKRVLERFEAGYHPSEEQLQRLRGAIDACEAMKVCGHLVDEVCWCLQEKSRWEA
jgi:hypothetical protein